MPILIIEMIWRQSNPDPHHRIRIRIRITVSGFRIRITVSGFRIRITVSGRISHPHHHIRIPQSASASPYLDSGFASLYPDSGSALLVSTLSSQ
jgi:hypothetical protein